MNVMMASTFAYLLQNSDVPSIKVEDFDQQSEGIKYANNFDIWKNINAMLHGTLNVPEMGATAIPPDQPKREYKCPDQSNCKYNLS
jgi:hypothetical protein